MFFLSIALLFLTQTQAGLALPSHSLQGFCQQALRDDANFEDLQAKIDQCHLKSIEAVIPLLSSAHRSQYVLMHHSQSLQGSSFQAPRAILYGKDAKLVITFNGDPEHSHFNHLEILQFRDQAGRFEARDISFSAKKAEYSEPNPGLCLSCHQNNPRPLWESYPLWPGAYGSEDDALFRPGSQAIGTTAEGKAYTQFLRTAQKGRYRFLSARPQAALPNTSFGSLLQKLNEIRIARKMKEDPRLWPFRYAILGANACFYSEQNIESFIPAALSQKFKTSLRDLSMDTAKINQAEFLNRIDFLQDIDRNAPEDARVKEILEIMQQPVSQGQVSDQMVSRMRWIIENQGLKTDDWSMQPASSPLDFENGYTGIAEMRIALSEALLNPVDELDLMQILHEKMISDSDLESVCQSLKAKSLGELNPFKKEAQKN